jgi:hypothetical protein
MRRHRAAPPSASPIHTSRTHKSPLAIGGIAAATERRAGRRASKNFPRADARWGSGRAEAACGARLKKFQDTIHRLDNRVAGVFVSHANQHVELLAPKLLNEGNHLNGNSRASIGSRASNLDYLNYQTAAVPKINWQSITSLPSSVLPAIMPLRSSGVLSSNLALRAVG